LSEKAGSWSSMISNPSGYDVSLEREISEEDFEQLTGSSMPSLCYDLPPLECECPR
jgi:hypothetical protein